MKMAQQEFDTYEKHGDFPLRKVVHFITREETQGVTHAATGI